MRTAPAEDTCYVRRMHLSARLLADAAATCVESIEPEPVQELFAAIGASRRVFFVGAGRTGLVARTLVMRLRQMGREAFMAGESATPAASVKDLVIVCSGSFRSTTTLAIYEKTVEAKIPTAVITSSAGAPNYGKASPIVVIPVDAHAKHAPLGTMFELSLQLLFDSWVLTWMQEWGIGEKSMRARHANIE
jgi:6-phospho-3-hexuloisomerase